MKKLNIKNPVLKELYTLVMLTAASALMAFNIKSFIDAGGMFPGSFSGLSILVQKIGDEFFGVSIPYSIMYIPLNVLPAVLGFKYLGRKFTLYSFYVIFLSGILTDLLPRYPITYDPLLISIFGGIVGGVAAFIYLNAGASSGGTDFISMYLAEEKGINGFYYILSANVVMLTVAGILFGFDKALYSIIYQYTLTQVINITYKRYQQDTLIIITEKSEDVFRTIKSLTRHDATLIKGTGCYEGKERDILYSVVSREEVNHVIKEIKNVDPKAFINAIKTDQLNGTFYRKPTK